MYTSHVLADTLTIHELEGRVMEMRVIVGDRCTHHIQKYVHT